MFSCLPSKSKCEWQKLRGFVEYYNSITEKERCFYDCYRWHSTRPQPEFAIQDAHGTKTVLEHKIIAWPADFLNYHAHFHEFCDLIQQRLSPAFQDDAYLLEINEKEVQANRPKLKMIVAKLSGFIIKNQNMVRRSKSIRMSQPLKWSFRRLPHYQRDDYWPEKGIIIQTSQPQPSWDEVHKEQLMEKEGIRGMLREHLMNVSKKFEGYEDCIRIFITELYSDAFLPSSHTDLLEIIRDTEIPGCIDQIWVGFPRWINENECQTCYANASIEKRSCKLS